MLWHRDEMCSWVLWVSVDRKSLASQIFRHMHFFLVLPLWQKVSHTNEFLFQRVILLLQRNVHLCAHSSSALHVRSFANDAADRTWKCRIRWNRTWALALRLLCEKEQWRVRWNWGWGELRCIFGNGGSPCVSSENVRGRWREGDLSLGLARGPPNHPSIHFGRQNEVKGVPVSQHHR